MNHVTNVKDGRKIGGKKEGSGPGELGIRLVLERLCILKLHSYICWLGRRRRSVLIS